MLKRLCPAGAVVLMLSVSACDQNANTSSSGFTDAAENRQVPTDTTDCASVIPGEDFRNDLLCAHNALRQSIPAPQPVPDPPLPQLSWSEELADFARAHAESCNYQHSDPALREEAFGQWTGENLAAATAGAYSNQAIFNLWANEAADYDYQANSCAPGAVCGHYTQLVWRETTQVGCARTTCDTLTNQESMGRADYWVCNYLPGGNLAGQRPY